MSIAESEGDNTGEQYHEQCCDPSSCERQYEAQQNDDLSNQQNDDLSCQPNDVNDQNDLLNDGNEHFDHQGLCANPVQVSEDQHNHDHEGTPDSYDQDDITSESYDRVTADSASEVVTGDSYEDTPDTQDYDDDDDDDQVDDLMLGYTGDYADLLVAQDAAQLLGPDHLLSGGGHDILAASNLLSNHAGALLGEQQILEDMLNLRLNNGNDTELDLPVFPPLRTAVTTTPSIYPHLYNLPPSLTSSLPPSLTPMSSTTTTLSLAGGIGSYGSGDVITTLSHHPPPASSMTWNSPSAPMLPYTTTTAAAIGVAGSNVLYPSSVATPPTAAIVNNEVVVTNQSINDHVIVTNQSIIDHRVTSDVTNGFPQHKTDIKIDTSVSSMTTQKEAVKVVNNNKDDSSNKQNVTSGAVKSTVPPPQKSRESQKTTKPVKTCNHKHNNPNAKELRNLMEKKNSANPLKKSKSANSFPVKDVSGISSSEECSSPEDSCSSSTSGTDKNCACCYCEVFGHSGQPAAPVSNNYPQMRERLRLLLNKKKRSSNKAAAAAGQPVNKEAVSKQQVTTTKQAPPVTAKNQGQQSLPKQPTNSVAKQPPNSAAKQPPTSAAKQQPNSAAKQQPTSAAKQPPTSAAKQVPANNQKLPSQRLVEEFFPEPFARHYEQFIEGKVETTAHPTCPQRSVLKSQVESIKKSLPAENIAKKDVDEILDFIEGNKNVVNEKKRQKKERQKQQRLEELRAKQEEERKRKEAEEAARKKREEEERIRKEMEEKAAKKMKKKAAQKAKKMAAKGVVAEDTNSGVNLESLHLRHIQQQKELLEKQKQELIEQQKMLDLQLQINFPGASKTAPVPPVTSTAQPTSNTSKKAAKKAAKAAAKQPPAAPVTTPAYPSYASHQANGPGATNNRVPAMPSSFYPPPSFNAPRPSNMGAMNQMFSGYPQQPSNAMPFMHPSAATPAAGFHPGQMMQPRFQGGYPPSGGGNASFNPAAGGQSAKIEPAKPDQPMVTIKRVMRPDTNEPTVTISVKKEEKDHVTAMDKEKVLFTLINGQVMKTSHAPDNLIPSAKPLSRDLAKQFLPDDLQEATLTKNQRKKLKKRTKEGEGETAMTSSSLPTTPSALSFPLSLPTSHPPSAASAKASPLSNFVPQSKPLQGGGSMGPRGLGGAPQHRVPLTPEGHVDLKRLTLPDGISISKITGPVPERKYFPSKPGPDVENSQFWPHQHPDFQHHNVPAFSSPGAGGDIAQNGAGGPKLSAEEAMYANNPNVILVDTNTLPTREEEEKAEAEKLKKKKKGKSPDEPSAPNAANTANYPVGGVEYTPGQPLPPAVAAGGSGQVLIKSVNGRVVITPVAEPPQAANVGAPQFSQVTANDLAPDLSDKLHISQKLATANGQQMAVVNGNGATTDNATDSDEANKKKKKKKKKNSQDNLSEINSVFAPREGVDLSGDMDAADREIEQFKQFCLNSVLLQNRTKVNLDLKSIKKKE